jgi:hypothetical protein
MDTRTTEKHEVTCAYCREQFRVERLRALAPLVVRCPHCLSVCLLPTAIPTKAAA